MRGENGLAIFAKAPVPGRSKTRLIPRLGVVGAARLAGAFIEDLVGRLGPLAAFDVELWAADEGDLPHFATLRVPLRVQVEGDLGVRMENALEDLLGRYRRAYVLGADVPTLPTDRLLEAQEALRASDIALGPSNDGGFYLVGARRPIGFGDRVRWSTPHALHDTEAYARHRGWTVSRIGEWYDVDEASDLEALRQTVRAAPGVAPRTLRVITDFDPRPADE